MYPGRCHVKTTRKLLREFLSEVAFFVVLGSSDELNCCWSMVCGIDTQVCFNYILTLNLCM